MEQAVQGSAEGDYQQDTGRLGLITKAPSKAGRSSAAKDAKPAERKNLKPKTRATVLTEAGYRCAVPTCRGILALDMHHMYQVKDGGGDDPANLIALCPTCHALYHRGNISPDAIYTYKSMLVAISRAFDLEAVDKLLFLLPLPEDFLVVSGDGLLHFARLIAANLASAELMANNNGLMVTYAVNISDKGRHLIDAWRAGDRTRLKQVIGGPVAGADLSGGIPAVIGKRTSKRRRSRGRA